MTDPRRRGRDRSTPPIQVSGSTSATVVGRDDLDPDLVAARVLRLLAHERRADGV